MTTFTTVPVSPGATHVAGIDVDQLLRAIGESSAKDSSTVLFGLLLSAQRVLAQVQDGGVCATTQRESALWATYHTLNDAGQDWLVGFAMQLQKRFARQRAALTLVQSGRDGSSR
jgi:hypothetical protein